MKTSAVIVAGGKGTRMGAGMNKVFLKVCGEEIISRTIRAFNSCPIIDEIILVTSTDDIERMQEIISCGKYKKVIGITNGGQERSDSVFRGLQLATGDIVLIHDGARCLVSQKEITDVVSDTVRFGSAAVGVKVKDTLKAIDALGNIISTVDRSFTVRIQTPQCFKTSEILALHQSAKSEDTLFTDDCSIFEYYGKTVHFTEGSYDNIKITTPEDITIAEEVIKRKER